jgi:DNA primase
LTNTFVDFRAVKQLASMEAVLDRYNVRLRRSNSHSLRGTCPLPTHTSEKSKESFGVDLTKNIWACQSTSCAAARAGKKGGNVIDFVAVMEQCSIRDAALKLQDWFGSSSSVPAAAKVGKEKPEPLVAEKKEGSEEVNKPLTFTLRDVDPTHPYLQQRGITEETARHFEVGFFPGRGMMSGRCVIPIHNETGELVAYAGRAIDTREPKYKLPTGFRKSAVLFNLHRMLTNISQQDAVIIVEGFFDCMKVWQAGRENVIALMGSTISAEQVELLKPFEKVILVLDGDQAGREGTVAIANALIHSHFVKVISLPDGKQPDRMSSEDIRSFLKL